MSVFDLIKSPDQLEASNEGFSSQALEQVSCQRGVAGDSFTEGELIFQFQITGSKWWIPDRSFLRGQVTLTRGDGTQLTESDLIAPALNSAACLFSGAECQIGGQTVSKISSYLPQISSLHTRMNNSASWIDSVGASTGGWGDFNLRRIGVTSDGTVDAVTPLTWYTGSTLTGIAATTTLAFVQITNILTFDTDVANPNLVIPVGSLIRFPAPAVTTFKVVQWRSDYTCLLSQVSGTRAENVDAAVVAFDVGIYGEVEPSDRAKTYEWTWKPPLSVLDSAQGIPGSLDVRLILTPQSSTTYQRQFCNSTLGKGAVAQGTGAGDVKLTVVSMYLMNQMLVGTRLTNESFYLDLKQYRMQAAAIGSAGSSEHTFEISPSTWGVAIAFQDARAGTDTRCPPTEFIAYNAAYGAKMNTKLTSFYATYAGKTYNSPATNVTDDAANNKLTVAGAYVNTMMQNGSYFGNGGAESIVQWVKRGPYYFFTVPRDRDDRSTRITIHIEVAAFDAADDSNKMRLCCFDISRQNALVEIMDGQFHRLELSNH